MYTDSEHRPVDGGGSSIVKEQALTDLDIDQQLLGLPGISLVVFTSVGCSSCRWAHQQLPVCHLPALFVVCEGQFLGQIQTRLTPSDLTDAIHQALTRTPEDLP